MKPSELIIIVAVLALGVGLTARFVMSPAQPATPFTEFSLPDTTDKPHNSTEWQGKIRIINFWATWCPPCVEELPLINAFYRQNKANGWQVLGLAVDKVSPVQTFLQKMPLDFPIGMAGLGGAELGRNLGNLAGGLPFTVVFGANGVVLHRKMGRVTAEDLDAWVRLK